MVEHAKRREVDAFFAANAQFHELFAIASGNQKLEEMYRVLMGQMARYLARSLALRGSLEKSVAEHWAILEAVEAGDAERAAAPACRPHRGPAAGRGGDRRAGGGHRPPDHN